ncbi:hypothetical protein HK097_007168 [Rhizophlyctis rosea]|uniref:Reelin domain-containing protein n=1 Tax=Rhizophlyctis rosea TaxID=64517 RepID=A0AAD5SJY8_9FUNG|nr:hypothetical protein HK097_007168 [Rhizophlyctis rosea]
MTTGAPLCNIDSAAIEAAHQHPLDPTLGYTFKVTPSATDKNTFEIRLANSAGSTSFKGLLLYVTADGDDKKHLGKFTNLDTTKYQFRTEKCTEEGVAGDAESTVTHMNPSAKFLAETVFTWQALDADLAITGPVKVHGVVAKVGIGLQSLDPVEIPLGGGGTVTAVGTGEEPTPTPEPTPETGGDVTTIYTNMTMEETPTMAETPALDPTSVEAPTATVPMVPSTTSCTR